MRVQDSRDLGGEPGQTSKRVSTGTPKDGAVDSTQAAIPWLDLIVSHRRTCQSDIHEPPWEGDGVAVERGNPPNSKRCSDPG